MFPFQYPRPNTLPRHICVARDIPGKSLFQLLQNIVRIIIRMLEGRILLFAGFYLYHYLYFTRIIEMKHINTSQVLTIPHMRGRYFHKCTHQQKLNPKFLTGAKRTCPYESEKTFFLPLPNGKDVCSVF